MKLELRDDTVVVGTIELPLEKLIEIADYFKESLDLGSGSVASPAQHDTGAG